MRFIPCLHLVVLFLVASHTFAAPVPEPKYAKPAVIDAGREENMEGLLEGIVWDARLGVREDQKVAQLPIVRQQKDWQEWLKKNLRVEREAKTLHVRISFRDGKPADQAAIINAVVDHYLKVEVERTRKSWSRPIELGRQQLSDPDYLKRLTAEEVEKGWKGLKKQEERVRTLPKLLESAKVR